MTSPNTTLQALGQEGPGEEGRHDQKQGDRQIEEDQSVAEINATRGIAFIELSSRSQFTIAMRSCAMHSCMAEYGG